MWKIRKGRDRQTHTQREKETNKKSVRNRDVSKRFNGFKCQMKSSAAPSSDNDVNKQQMEIKHVIIILGYIKQKVWVKERERESET